MSFTHSFSSESFFDETDKFLLSLVSQLHVLDQLAELQGPIVGQHEGVASLEQEVDELRVVTRRDATQSRVRRCHIRCHGGLQELPQR